MPHTVNGVGTHYYGKRNKEVHNGTCQSCGYRGNVSAYDTRLWFVVFFIPIIPLGRKRILNDCPNCRRHFVVPLAKWEAQKQLTISGAAEEFRSNPTPDAAIALHEQLLGFQQMSQAAELRGLMAGKFPADAKVHEYLGVSLSQLGNVKEADGYFLRAHELRPDLPNARAGVAQLRIREGKLDEARALLDFMEKPGAAQLYNLGPLETLGDALQGAGRSADALDLYKKLIAELPAVAQHAGFRKKVEVAQKAVAKQTGAKIETILPKKKFSWRGMFRRSTPAAPASGKQTLAVIGIILLVIAAGLAIRNEWVRQHREIFVVNGLAAPVIIEIAGAGSVKVPPGGRESFTVGEGDYHARITGAATEEVDVPVHADYFDRWGEHPVWVLNPGGAAILERTVAVYSRKGDLGSVEYSSGEVLTRFNDVQYPFKPLPRTQSVKSSEGSRTLTGLEVFNGPAAALFVHYLSSGRTAEAVRFAEQHLRARPDDAVLRDAYEQYKARKPDTSPR